MTVQHLAKQTVDEKILQIITQQTQGNAEPPGQTSAKGALLRKARDRSNGNNVTISKY